MAVNIAAPAETITVPTDTIEMKSSEDPGKIVVGRYPQEIIEDLYSVYTRKACKEREKQYPDLYRIGRCDGAVEVLESIIVSVSGMERVVTLWEENQKEAKA